MNNYSTFASNYPKPEVVFAHACGERMLVERVTVATPVSSKTGAYPMGEGLLFLADSLAPFELTDAFANFTAADYDAWKEVRLRDPHPLRPHEPVAYFQLDE